MPALNNASISSGHLYNLSQHKTYRSSRTAVEIRPG